MEILPRTSAIYLLFTAPPDGDGRQTWHVLSTVNDDRWLLNRIWRPALCTLRDDSRFGVRQRRAVPSALAVVL